ncbi:MAG: flavin reductase family protein, partial [Pseudomonadota bacterium]
DQEDVSNRFAAKGGSPLSDDEVTTHKTGAPLLRDRLAGFDCSIFARHNAGDHVILVGKVEHYDSFAGAPLLYYASEYAVGPDSSKR